MRPRLLWTACLLAAATSLPITAAEKRDGDEEAWVAARDAGAVAGYKAYLKEFPKGRHAAAARVKLAILTDAGGTQPSASTDATTVASTKSDAPKAAAATTRPHLPFELSEDVWAAIDKSGLATTAMPRKTVEVAYTESTDSDFAKLHVQTMQIVNKRIAPLPDAPGYQEIDLRQEISWTNSNGGRGAPKTSSSRDFLLGSFLPLGTIDGDGNVVARLRRINELQGSFYPLRIGSEVSVRYDFEYVANHAYDSTVTAKCRIIAKTPAANLSPQLSGDAWQLNCQTTTVMSGKTTDQSNDKQFIIGDWGVLNQQFQVFDFSKKSMVIPNGRYQFQFMTSAHTIDGYRITARD